MKTPKAIVLALGILLISIMGMGSVRADVLPVDSNLDNSQSGFGTLRTAIIDACSVDGDDDITFNTWSASFPNGGNHTIVLDGPLVIPSDCKGKVRIFGQLDAQEGVEVTIDATNVADGQCALTIEKDDTLVQNINIIKSKGTGLCVKSNKNIVANVNLGYKALAKTVAGNKKGGMIEGNENVFYNGVITGNTTYGLFVGGNKNKVQSSYVGTTAENEAGAKNNTFANGDGIQVKGSNNVIGGSLQFKNTVAHNNGTGIAILDDGSLYNDLAFTIIYKNGGSNKLGIDLKNDGVTENADCGLGGPNNCLDFPYALMSQNQGPGLYVVKGKAPAGSTIFFYQINDNDDTHGEGQILLGTYNTGGNENSPDQVFAFQLSGQGLQEGNRISTMACRKGGTARDCSEFSGVIELHNTPSTSPDPIPTPDGQCGNFLKEAPEECDDGNLIPNDGCDENCLDETIIHCGNTIVESPEECDDGNQVDNDACKNDCTANICGDTVDGGPTSGPNGGPEECDDGAGNSDTTPNSCRTNCANAFCGDGVTDPANNEECDDANQVNDDACDNTCKIVVVPPCDHDGTVDPGEECDDSNATDLDGCDKNCRIECDHDGIKEGFELCDDGNMIDNDGCSGNCIIDCDHDGVVEGFELCDDGNSTNNDGCDANCVIECNHNGIIDGFEQCDDGNQVDNDTCSNQCVIVGCDNDGAVEGSEQCDDGNTSSGDGCSAGCTIECDYDTVTEGLEQCDDGNHTNGDGCSAICTIECDHDGVTEGIEQCDDGNQTDNDGCTANCQIECDHDGTKEGFEQCDDGNQTGGDGCAANCTIECDYDSTVDGLEQCDDGNHVAGDGCDQFCQIECDHDGTKEGLEQCDDGNTANNDGCTDHCMIECDHDGVKEGFEECDDGNTNNNDQCSNSCQIINMECAPINLTAEAVSAKQIDLDWTDTCPDEVKFLVERATGTCAAPGPFVQTAELGVNQIAHSDLGPYAAPELTSNTSYAYRVRAELDGSHFSAYSNCADATTWPTPSDYPKPAVHLIATAQSTSTIKVEWIDDAINETGYRLQRAKDSCSNPFVDIQTLPANTDEFLDTGLDPATFYCYRVIAFNPVGDAAPSNEDGDTTFSIPIDVPNPATHLDVHADGPTQITVTWDDNANNEDGYQIERTTDLSCNPATFTLLDTVPANTTIYVDVGLTPGTLYCYRVRPFNSVGPGGYSNIDSDTTPNPNNPPAAPTTLIATKISSTQIEVEFTDNSGNGSDEEEGFELYRINQPCSTIPATPVLGTDIPLVKTLPPHAGTGLVTYDDLNLQPSTTYCYVVRAFNANGPSAQSNKDDATTDAVNQPIPNAPLLTLVDPQSPTQMKVVFTDQSDDETAFVVQRHDGQCGSGTFVDIDILSSVPGSGNVVTFFDNTVEQNTTYCYRIVAHNLSGDSFSNELGGTTPDSGCPADVDADNICDPNDEGGSNTPPTDTDNDGIPDAGDTDSDNDTIPDHTEEGDGNVNTPPVDTDSDGTPDFRDQDSDNDCVPDSVEGIVDTDGDGIMDFRDTDSDGDGVLDNVCQGGGDNCRVITNPGQEDGDHDGIGDACDTNNDTGCPGDQDCDGILDGDDNCPTVANPLQEDDDHDDIGNACDPSNDVGSPVPMSLFGGGCTLNAAGPLNQGAWNFLLVVLPALGWRAWRVRRKD